MKSLIMFKFSEETGLKNAWNTQEISKGKAEGKSLGFTQSENQADQDFAGVVRLLHAGRLLSPIEKESLAWGCFQDFRASTSSALLENKNVRNHAKPWGFFFGGETIPKGPPNFSKNLERKMFTLNLLNRMAFDWLRLKAKVPQAGIKPAPLVSWASARPTVRLGRWGYSCDAVNSRWNLDNPLPLVDPWLTICGNPKRRMPQWLVTLWPHSEAIFMNLMANNYWHPIYT